MSFIIDQNICIACGSCSANCSNRAIIRRGEGFFVTEMCCDCGICINYCPINAIGKGKTKAEFDNKKMDKALKDKLSLKRHIVAMKFADKAPKGAPVYDGLNFWCAICGDILEGKGKPTFFTTEKSTCGGSAMIGIGLKKATKEEVFAVWDDIVIGEGNLFATKDLLVKGRPTFPLYPKIYGGVILGSLEDVSMPDVILFPVSGNQMCMVSTAYAFDTGEIIMGYAGSATCVMTVTIPFLENKPVFSSGDHGGRTFMRLKEEEILVCFPYRLVPGLVKNLDRTVYAQESHGDHSHAAM